jgi:uncharacterized membrane protein
MRAYLLLPLLLSSACSYRVEKEPPVPIGGELGFAEIQAILGPKCISCHGAMLVSYESLLPSLGQIAARIQSQVPAFMMPPPGNAPLTTKEREAVLDWIARGAPREGGSQELLPVPPPPAAPIVIPGLNFAFVQQEVLKPKCAGCHGKMVSSYEGVLANLQEIERRVRSTTFDQMPPDWAEEGLTEAEKSLLLDWIKAGAPEHNQEDNEETEEER